MESNSNQLDDYKVKRVDEIYPFAVEFIQNERTVSGIGISLFQRKFRINYDISAMLMTRLVKNKIVEPYQQWIGNITNGVRTEGYKVTLYRIVQTNKLRLVNSHRPSDTIK